MFIGSYDAKGINPAFMSGSIRDVSDVPLHIRRASASLPMPETRLISNSRDLLGSGPLVVALLGMSSLLL